MNRRPCIAITLGDPCGIGPELLLGSLAAINRWTDVMVVGARAGVALLGPSSRVAWRWGAPEGQIPPGARPESHGLRTTGPDGASGYATWLDPTPEITADQLLDLKEKHPGALVVSYVNTTAAVKAESDICCTSANAVQVVRSLPADCEIIFVPDRHLGAYTAEKLGRSFVLWPGFCPTHDLISPEAITLLKKSHPKALVLVHPECRPEVIDMADKVASTEGILKFAKSSDAQEFIIATEGTMTYESAVCPTMKMITRQMIIRSLETLRPAIELPEDVMDKARKPLERMMEIGRGE